MKSPAISAIIFATFWWINAAMVLSRVAKEPICVACATQCGVLSSIILENALLAKRKPQHANIVVKFFMSTEVARLLNALLDYLLNRQCAMSLNRA